MMIDQNNTEIMRKYGIIATRKAVASLQTFYCCVKDPTLGPLQDQPCAEFAISMSETMVNKEVPSLIKLIEYKVGELRERMGWGPVPGGDHT